jgi:hypothetical protein
MSAWAAIEARDAASTTALGNGVLHGISGAAVGGFAIGALLTGLCFLMIVAPRAARQARLSARLGRWPSFVRRPRVQRDYYAEPAETYSTAGDTDSLSAESEMIYAAAPVADDLLADDLLAEDPEAADDLDAAEDPEADAAPGLAEHPVRWNPTALAATPDFAGHAGADPYAVESVGDLDVELALEGNEVLVEDQPRTEGGRGYRSKHRLSEHEPSERRGDSRRSAPRHAAPSARFGGRVASKLASSKFALFPLVAARG